MKDWNGLKLIILIQRADLKSFRPDFMGLPEMASPSLGSLSCFLLSPLWPPLDMKLSSGVIREKNEEEFGMLKDVFP